MIRHTLQMCMSEAEVGAMVRMSCLRDWYEGSSSRRDSVKNLSFDRSLEKSDHRQLIIVTVTAGRRSTTR